MTPATYELLTPAARVAAVLPGARCPHCGGPLNPAMRLVLEREDGVERVAHWICSVEESAA